MSDPGRVWLSQYDPGQPSDIVPDFEDGLTMFRAAVARAADRPAVRYFDGALTFADLDCLSDKLATHLLEAGFGAGDRLAIYLQNVPAFPIALLAAWKAGGVAVAVNPMLRERELALLLADCTPTAIVCHASLYETIVSNTAADIPRIVLTTSRLDFQTRNDPRLFADAQPTPTGSRDLMKTLAARSHEPPPTPDYAPERTALLVYTSGTTGLPKAAILSHGNVTFNAQVYRDWMHLPPHGPILALAPLFHVTGLIGHIAAAMITDAPLILSYRFHPQVMRDSIAEHRPVYAIGAITALAALLHAPGTQRGDLASLEVVGSGGAPIPKTIVDAFHDAFGLTIHNGYGLTETTSPCHVVPLTRTPRIDPGTGLMSIGVPVFNTHAWIAADDGTPAPPGEIGEIVVSGPMVASGYWRQPAATAEFMREDGFRTGDVGFMDEDGWFFIVDRKKDMINAGGYKVWPREVEDVLYQHVAVREAAVVGIPDDYRGETVKAAVSLKSGHSADANELIGWCKSRMAAYKYPRIIEIRDELPKTPTGKILRRMIG